MQTVLMVCGIIFTAAIVVGTVYFVITLIQVTKTAREVESLARNINTASPLISLMFLGGGLFTTITNKLRSLFGKHTKGGKLK